MIRAAAVAVVAAGCTVLAACSYASNGGAAASSTPTSSEASEPPTSSAPAESPTTTSIAPTPTSASSSVAAKHNTCPKGALTVRLLPGGAIPQHELAAVSVVNDGTEPCLVWGFPQVQLELNGAPLGSPAVPRGTPQAVTLPRGSEAQALITDDSTCNAQLSDTLSVTLPESTVTATRPMQLRGCALHIDPFKPAQ